MITAEISVHEPKGGGFLNTLNILSSRYTFYSCFIWPSGVIDPVIFTPQKFVSGDGQGVLNRKCTTAQQVAVHTRATTINNFCLHIS